MEWLVATLIWLYYQCAHFMVHFADFTGTTYRDANSLLFFVLWPLCTVLLFFWCCWNTYQLVNTLATGEEVGAEKSSS